ncbi:MAG: hypothetical protein ACEPOV_00225 [Hyphomicrobiales bacterium]
MSDQQLLDILSYAILAPSSHNAQMWSVNIVNNQHIVITLNYNRTLPKVDPYNRESWISLGAFVENCVLAATGKGFDTKVKVISSRIHLHFLASDKSDKSILQIIKERHTNRKPYLQEALSSSHINDTINLSDDIRYYPMKSEECNFIAKHTFDAFKEQMKDEGILKELAEWMTFSSEEEKHKNVGLSPLTIGMSKINHFLFNMFMNKSQVTKSSFYKGSVKGLKKQLNSCSGFFIITSTEQSISSLIDTGRLLQKLWIECTKLQIAIHPVSYAVEQSHHNKSLKKQLKLKKQIQLIIRVGKSLKEIKQEKRRIPVEGIAIK